MRSREPIPFASYAPDRGKASGAGHIAKGVLSFAGRYVPLQDLAPYKSTPALLNDICLGGVGVYSSTGVPIMFLGDRGRLYRLVDRAPQDISRTGGYTVDQDWQWSFMQFGDNILAAQRGAPLQRFQINGTPTFEDVPDAPQADVVFRIRNHGFACSGRTVNWSAFNDILNWEPDGTTQAGNTLIGQEAGVVTAGIGGEQGAIFQERGIIRVTYQGGDVPWFFDEVEGGRGACSPDSVKVWGRGAFVCAEDGFYLWDGLNAQPIGQGRVDRTFASDLNYPYRGRITSAIDAERKCWMVAYPAGASTICNKILIYSWADDRWTHDEFDVQALLDMPKEGVSIDDLASVINIAGTGNIDAMTISFDSPAWRESRRSWAAVDTTRQVKTFTGPNRRAQFETGQVEPIPGRQAYISEIAPILDAQPGEVYAELYGRPYRLASDEHLLDTAAMNELGSCEMRGEAQFIRATVEIASGSSWSEAIGTHWSGKQAGTR